MSNSKLVTFTQISPNRNSPRNHKIDKITIHHMAGNCSITSLGRIFADPKREGSSNYGIGSDGTVGLFVDEGDRSWCSSSRDNDHRAVTIEVADDVNKAPWHSSQKAMSKLVLLCADICKRNGIKELNYTGNTNGNLTLHKWFVNTDCPGSYLEKNMKKIASEVNLLLKYNITTYTWDDNKTSTVNVPKTNNTTSKTTTPTKKAYSGAWPTLPARGYFQKGDKGAEVTKLQKFLLWYDSKCLPRWGADGSLGDEGIAAVRKFQDAEKLKADGLFGKSSLAKAKTIKK